jgi:AcrR family transcriptional regulator
MSVRPRKLKELEWGGRGEKDNRRDVILRALNTVLREHKRPQSFRMKDLADHLGLVKGNLYYYFRNKQELLYQCRIRCLQEDLEILNRVRASPLPGSEKLLQLLQEHILVLIEGDYSAALLQDAGNMTAARRRKYVALRDEFEAGVRQLIEEGIAAGEFPSQDVRMASFAILGSINWIPKWYKPCGPMTAREIAAYQARFFVSALAAQKKVLHSRRAARLRAVPSA